MLETRLPNSVIPRKRGQVILDTYLKSGLERPSLRGLLRLSVAELASFASFSSFTSLKNGFR